MAAPGEAVPPAVANAAAVEDGGPRDLQRAMGIEPGTWRSISSPVQSYVTLIQKHAQILRNH